MNSFNHKELYHQAYEQKYKGFVLITVMLLLTILSLSGFVAFEISQFNYKTNQARFTQMHARHISEEARLLAKDELESLLLNTSNGRITDSNALNESKGSERSKGSANLIMSMDDLEKTLQIKSSESSRFEKQGLEPFLEISKVNSSATVYIQAFPAQMIKNGTELSQHMTYSREGQGLGGRGSFSKNYELRAKGVTRHKGNDVIFWSASDYRFIP